MHSAVAPALSRAEGRLQRGAEVRLQLRDALAGLRCPDLAAQSAFAVETLLQQGDPALLEFFQKECFRSLADSSGSVRKAHYRLAVQALRAHPPAAQWGGVLLHLRDRLLDRCGLEDHAPAAAELQALAQQLTAAVIDAYCRGQYPALGHCSKADLPRDWLSQLLLGPLLRAACRGPARTRVANACLLVHGVLLELRRWSKSGGVLHAAVDCLKQILKLTSSGALALCAGEALLPLQSCVVLLGPRLKAAALEGILQLCTRAMQRSEWQVRKAAADTLAVLASTLLESGAADQLALAGSVGQQHQGLAALEALAPAIAAAVEQHIKYDRIPQVRQAAVALLHQLHQLPSQQEQRQPAQQLPGAASASSGSGLAAEAVAEGAVAASPKGRCRGNLQAVIAERRRQFRESTQLPGAAVLGAIPRCTKAAGPAAATHASSIGSDGVEAPGEHSRILAWPEASQQRHSPAARPGAAKPMRPPSADAFRAAEVAMRLLQAQQQAGEATQQPDPEHLQQQELESELEQLGLQPQREQQQPHHQARRRWGSGSRPSSPPRQELWQAPRDVPVQVFVAGPPSPASPAAAAAQQRQEQQRRKVWHENPLAESPFGGTKPLQPAEGLAAAGLAAAPQGAAPCVHHVDHPQFRLRLQATPAEAELTLAGGSSEQPAAGLLSSLRLWTQNGADVGIEFSLAASTRSAGTPPMLHRYWLCLGQLHQEHVAGSPARHGPSPTKQHTPQQQRGSGSSGRLAEQQAQQAEAANLPVESPLATLATAALPSFSPAKPAGAAAAAAAADCATPAAAAGPSRSPAGLAGLQEPSSGSASCSRSSPGSPPPTGPRSCIPRLQPQPAAVRWAASLRPPGEQLLPGLPDWDRSSRPSSPRSVPLSRAGSRAGSRPASPSRLSQPRAQGEGHAAECQQEPQGATPCHHPQQEQQQQRSTPLPLPPQEGHQQVECTPPPLLQHRGPPEEQGQPGGGGRAAPGPLTAMVCRAVTKLQQLHELQEELQLPAHLGGGHRPAGPAAGAAAAGGGKQQSAAAGQGGCRQEEEQQLDPRRSLARALSAIPEGSPTDPGCSRSSAGASSEAGGRQRSGESSSSGGSEGHREEMSRLRQLHEQLSVNMGEIQKLIDEQAGSPKAGRAATAGAAALVAAECPGSCGSVESMPAAWDAQEQLPLPGGHHPSHLPHRQLHQPGGDAEEQATPGRLGRPGPCSPTLSAADGWYTPGSRLSPRVEAGAASTDSQQAAGSGGGAQQVLLTVSNPLFGTSRPGTVQGMQDMLPPKRSLQQRPVSQGGGGSGSRSSPGSAAAAAAAGRRQQAKPGHSLGAARSIDSFGSGFGALHRESEAEVQQFLRGSLLAGEQRRGAAAAAAAAAAPPPLLQLPAGGSLDMAAILGSRPASPDKSAGGNWQAASQEGGFAASWRTRAEAAGWFSSSSSSDDEEREQGGKQAEEQEAGLRPLPASGPGSAELAVADLQLLRISSRPASPDGARGGLLPAAAPRSPGQGAPPGAGGGNLADVVLQTFPAQAVERLGQLKAHLRTAAERQPAAPPAAVASRPASPCSSSQRSSTDSMHSQRAPVAPAAKAPAASSRSNGSGSSDSSSSQGSLQQPLLPRRGASPELAGVPGVSRRQARLLQSAIGRMPGNPGEAADASAIEAALMDVLAQQTAHVQKHYQRLAAERLAAARGQHGSGSHSGVVGQQARRLDRERDAAVRGDLAAFVEQALPRLAQVLSSRELLLRCLEAADEEEERRGG